jgi:hypothetical protein
MRRALLLTILVSAASVVASAQQPQASQGAPPLAPGEMQKLFDGYAVIQAQEFLGLSETQFASFLPKLRVFQETRRRGEQERMRLLQELNRMTSARAGQRPESGLRDRLRALRELETRTTGELQKARDAIDEILDVRQQARFRVFEDQLEQRKLQLLMQARQANRSNRPFGRAQP